VTTIGKTGIMANRFPRLHTIKTEGFPLRTTLGILQYIPNYPSYKRTCVQGRQPVRSILTPLQPWILRLLYPLPRFSLSVSVQ